MGFGPRSPLIEGAVTWGRWARGCSELGTPHVVKWSGQISLSDREKPGESNQV